MGNRKMKAYYWSTGLGALAFGLLVFKMDTNQLITLCQFFFGYQGLITAGFFGFNFGEHWSEAKKALAANSNNAGSPK